MGTRGIIGTAHDGGFSGRYNDHDSYPSGLGADLLASYAALGGDWKAVVAHAVRPERNGYWSSYLLPEQEQQDIHGWNDDAQDTLVTHTDDVGAEWVYLLDERGINLVAAMRATGQKAVGAFGSIGDIVWESVGKVAWDATDVDWARLECGENFERCIHYAWRHFPEAADTRVGTDVWLGRGTPSVSGLTRITHPTTGREYQLTGSGGTGSAQDGGIGAWRTLGPRTPRYWWASAKDSEGNRVQDIRLGRQLKAGLKLAWDGYAPTAAGEVKVPAGTLVRL